MKYTVKYTRKGKIYLEHDLNRKEVYDLLGFIEEHQEYALISIELEEDGENLTIKLFSGQIESEMLIDAESPEEAENKAREYCIDSVVSVKEKEYRQFIVMPEKCNWLELPGLSAEMVYRFICSDYPPHKRIAIMDKESGETTVFTRQLDKDGNIIKIERRYKTV